MTAFAQTLHRQQQEAAAIQTSERTKRRVVRRSPVVIEPLEPAEPPDEVFDEEHHKSGALAMAVSPQTEPASLPTTVTPVPQPSSTELGPLRDAAASTAISVSPLDLPTEFFSAGLDRRNRNRALLMDWLRTALVEGVDFGRIHIAGKDRCQLVRMGRVHECKDPSHWSPKASLFKPGAEKITGMLGMTVHYPTMPAYEDAILAQADIRTIMLRCELRDVHGHVVAQGAGARQISQDYGDLNKTLKMVAKSAHIDATLRLAGLSEVFTQDLEDRPLAGEFDAVSTAPQAAPRPAPKAPPRQPLATTNELIGIEQLQDLRQAITDHGFAEQRVLNWLYQATKGQVSRLEQLPLPMLTTLHKRLGQWADAEAASHTAGHHN